MKAFLMYKDRDFDPKKPLPRNEKDLTSDLELDTLFNAMAQGDKFLFDTCKSAVLSSLNSLEEIRYRQDILKDCLKNPAVIRELYQIPIESDENKHKRWLGIFTHSPSGVLSSSLDLMLMFVDMLRKLKKIAEDHAGEFESEGFTTFFATINQELTEEYFAVVEDHLKQLRFRNGVLISAELGKGNEGTNYTLRLPNAKNKNWVKNVFSRRSPGYSFWLSERDDAGMRALSDLRDRGVNLAANALAQSADHIDSYFNMLKIELAFYIGCINLYEQLSAIGNPVVFPQPEPASERRHSFRAMYDVCLALTTKQAIVGNDINADGKSLVMITGANQGGKSTFLRSIGLSQLMMQCGMFVPAQEFRANLSEGIFTHYKRREDATMKSGKFDEELSRMSAIVDSISPNALMLFNESFAATNEREGSEIASQITNALIDRNIKVFFVTHMYEFARTMFEKRKGEAIFLRAERKTDGKRTFKLKEGEPLPTSFGVDVYQTVFGTSEKK